MEFNGFIGEFFPIWKSSQLDLGKVIRWSPYLVDGHGKEMRKQTTLEHEHSFSLFAGTAAQMLDPFIFKKSGKHLDLLMLEYGFKWHDHAEGLKGRDIIAPDKKDEDDVEEYVIFMEHIKNMPDFVKEKYEIAFLLQFALNNNVLFTKRAEDVMSMIRCDLFYESLVFTALEKLEYLFYPIEMREKHKYLLAWVIKRQLPGYQKFAKILPGFREILFPESLEEKLLNYLEENKNIPAQEH